MKAIEKSVLAGLVASALMLSGCISFTEPKLSFSCALDEDGVLVMKFDHNARAHGPSNLELWRDGGTNYLWQVRFRQNFDGELRYGAIDSQGHDNPVEQLYPTDQRALPELMAREVIHLSMHYGYDEFIYACGSSDGVILKIPEKGLPVKFKHRRHGGNSPFIPQQHQVKWKPEWDNEPSGVLVSRFNSKGPNTWVAE